MIWVLGAIAALALLSALGQALSTTAPSDVVPAPAPPKYQWSEIPKGQDIALDPGFYAVVAMVKDSHDASKVKQLLADKGLVTTDYEDPAPPAGYEVKDGYRLVAAIAQATREGGTIPWKLPSPLSWFDDTQVLRAWKAVPAAAAAA